MTVLALPAGFRSVTVPNGAAYQLDMPVMRTGGLNVTGEGGSLLIADGRNAGEDRINISGAFSDISLINIRLNLPRDGRIRDALPMSPQCRRVYISRLRATGIHGSQANVHGDGIQTQDGSVIDELVIEDTTIYTAYQAMRTGLHPNGTGVKKLILRRVNIRDEPDLREQLSIAFFFGDRDGGAYTAPYDIVLEDVWVDWPDPAKVSFFPENARVTGTINLGVPPGGDFCPA